MNSHLFLLRWNKRKRTITKNTFLQVLIRETQSDLLFSTDIFNVEPLVRTICDITQMKYRDIMSIENLQINDPPVGIF